MMMRPSVRRSGALQVLLLLLLATICKAFDISFDQLRGKRILVVGGSGRKFMMIIKILEETRDIFDRRLCKLL